MLSCNRCHHSCNIPIVSSLPLQVKLQNSVAKNLYVLSLLQSHSQTRLMASSRDCPIGLKNRVVVMLIIAFIMFSSKSAGSLYLRGNWGLKQVKMMLGSRPPKCVNKCLSCKPCVATLVVPSHPKNRFKASIQEDENYYLLSWKCRCGNKLFHP